MWEQFRRFSALGPEAQKVFLRALALLPLVALSLRLRGVRATQASLQLLLTNADAETTDGAGARDPHLVSRMVNAADRYGLVHPSCLAKSLALWYLLAGQGIAAQLRVGVRKDAEKFEAHAWVECDGAALSEPEERHKQYASFDAALASLPVEER